MTLLPVIFGAIAAAAHAHTQTCEGHPYQLADGQSIICSATWSFAGICNGTDLWDAWKITGRTQLGDAFIRPWLDVPILVVGYELMKRQAHTLSPLAVWRNWTSSFFTIGSTITPDAMITLGPGEAHAVRLWPAGAGQPWPAAKDARAVTPIADADGKVYAAGGDLLDLHGACFGGGAVNILLTIYYTPQR